MEPGESFAATETRAAILEALPTETASFGHAPEPAYLYVPARHAQALSLDHGLVVGIRGAGKSVWWAALQSAEHRQVILQWLRLPPTAASVEVRAGFGEAPEPDLYPDKRVLRTLLEQVAEPADIWRTVMAWHSWQTDGVLGSLPTWRERVDWVVKHPEDTARKFRHHDDVLDRRGDKRLILFDALDRTADDWPTLRRLLRGLLQMLLEFRGYRAIRAKAFVRPDMLDDPNATSFPDASKITANRVELRWSRTDLYGLLYQRLGNAPKSGAAFRKRCHQMRSGDWIDAGSIWRLPAALSEDDGLQRAVFHKVAGDWMGTDHRRGFPYTWLPNHLADAADQVSPRSFLAAVRKAAEESPAHGDKHALHYEAIKRGVQEASRIRVAELKDDFPWVPALMEPLSGLVIPCPFREVERRWKSTSVMDRLRRLMSGGLLPTHFDEGAPGLRRDLLALGVFSEMPDGRVNMPDVYRVGFGLGRKGGVKPIR